MNIEADTTTVNERKACANPRLRVLELPMRHAGDLSETPFMFVFDRAGEGEELFPENLGEALRSLGASGTLVFGTELDLE